MTVRHFFFICTNADAIYYILENFAHEHTKQYAAFLYTAKHSIQQRN